MRASMSLPGIIAPVEFEGSTYIDGGFVRNLPTNAGRALCGDILIAVNLGTRPKNISEIRNSLDIAQQSYVILTEQNVQASLETLMPKDFLLVPDLKEFSSSSFSSQQEIIDRGEAVVLANRSVLTKIALTQSEYQEWLKARQNRELPPLSVTSITADSSAKISEKYILADVTTQPGTNFSLRGLTKDISHIFGRGDFSYVGYTTVPDDEHAAIVINAQRKPWGPGYLKVGLGVAADFNSATQLNFAAAYRRTLINSLGAEWRTDAQWGYDSFLTTEFIQPLQGRDGFFIAPYAGIRNNLVQFYKDEFRAGEYEVSRAFAGLHLGVTSNLGELKIGPYLRNIKAKPDFGLITGLVPEEKAKEIGLFIDGVYDQLDNLDFPRSGLLVAANARSANKKWGSEEEYILVKATVSGAKSYGKHTIFGHLEWSDELLHESDMPVYNALKLGGPRRLSGLYIDQLTGTQYTLAVLSYYNQFTTLPPQFGQGMYVGMSIEGGVIDDEFLKDSTKPIISTSLFWAADTILGSVNISYGYSSLRQSALYLNVSKAH